jgi:hypothetical protein
MTLNFLHIPVAVLKLPGLNLRQKLLLGLVISFDDKGLRMSNEELGEILDIWPSRVSKLFKDMESKGYVRIDNKQSQYRKIYLLQSATVALATKRNSGSGALATKRPSTVAQSRSRIEINKQARAHKEKSLCDESFQRFWSAYPKKIAKVEAQKVWLKLKPTPELVEQIIAAVERQKQTRQWQKDGGQFIPHPTTWLSQKRWEDELPEPKRGDIDWLPDEQEAEAIMKDAGL